ncbi:hypothetical protein RvY_04343 [Ramazzottius varieornatus]|uniref:Uncharacterized protein n=1 Tax=Ramazzottius varieornatus TaxID=947166 RepID=A0A1D1UUV9_RAMVA|nr:hypothetical protein RvY_04343 [Ramazzottius varieornatus]
MQQQPVKWIKHVPSGTVYILFFCDSPKMVTLYAADNTDATDDVQRFLMGLERMWRKPLQSQAVSSR